MAIIIITNGNIHIIHDRELLYCRNRVTHIICVPIIFWSFIVWLTRIPLIVLLERFPINISFALTFLYIFYYVLLEPVAGVSNDFGMNEF